jgi:hypothetical protein
MTPIDVGMDQVTYVRKEPIVLVQPSGVTLHLDSFTLSQPECVFGDDMFEKLQQQNPEVEFVDRTPKPREANDSLGGLWRGRITCGWWRGFLLRNPGLRT